MIRGQILNIVNKSLDETRPDLRKITKAHFEGGLKPQIIWNKK
jgi:hypothetical protein